MQDYRAMTKTEYELLIKPGEINFAPDTEIEEIMQNIITICTTAKYSVPMDRELGVNWTFIDDTIPTARNKIISEIVNAVRRYEPRARVTHINFTADGDGQMWPRIMFKLVNQSA